MDFIYDMMALPSNGQEWTMHIAIFLLNIVLLLFSAPVANFLNPGKNTTTKVAAFRAVNVTFLILHGLEILVGNAHPILENLFVNIAWSLLTVYLSMLLFNVLSYFSRRKFGAAKKVDNREIRVESYNSRLVDLFLIVFTLFFDFYVFIQIWNWDSMLETTGLFGVLIGFLALTNQIWAPDLYYGMVILNSQQIEDGDVIQFDDEKSEYIINKITFIYTILLNVRNNHRTMIRNSKMMDRRIDNLSKRASAEGLRYKMIFKIGYPPLANLEERQEREHRLSNFLKRIDSMFNAVNETIKAKDDVIHVDGKYPLEWHLTATGDYALEFSLYYTLESLPNTKVTRTIRKYIVASHNALMEEVYRQSIHYGIDLSTPLVVQQAQVTSAPEERPLHREERFA